METFSFRATAQDGTLEAGKIEARSKAEAYRALLGRDVRPVSIEAVPALAGGHEDGAVPKSGGGRVRISSTDLLAFAEELAELLESGLQLDNALKVMQSREEKGPLSRVAGSLRQDLREGISFSMALRRSEATFPDLFCSMIAAGEAAGALPRILRRQAEYLALIIDLRRRVSAALIYPSIVFAAGIVLLFIFMTFLLPQLTMLLSKTGQQLPLMTRILIGTSEFLGRYGWLLAIGVGAVGAAFWAWRSKPPGRLIWDRLKLRIPVAGGAISAKFLAEFCQTLATLILSGVTLLDGLALLRRATGNLYLKELLSRLVDRVSEGASLAGSLRYLPFFPPVLCDIIMVGEQSGDLASALQRAARRYDREFSSKVQKITALIQPLTILIVAIFVGVVAYSMITGILSSVSGLRTR